MKNDKPASILCQQQQSILVQLSQKWCLKCPPVASFSHDSATVKAAAMIAHVN